MDLSRTQYLLLYSLNFDSKIQLQTCLFTGTFEKRPPGFESGNLHNNPYLKSLVMLIPLFPLIFIFCIFVFFSNFAIFSCFDFLKF